MIIPGLGKIIVIIEEEIEKLVVKEYGASMKFKIRALQKLHEYIYTRLMLEVDPPIDKEGA